MAFTETFTQTTELGRHVRLEDWLGFNRDRMLATLYQMRDTGGDDNGMTIEQIAALTGLHVHKVYELVNSMKEKPKLVQPIVPGVPVIWVLTPRGIRWVEESPKQP